MKNFRKSFTINKSYLKNSHIKEAGICISKSKRLFLKEKCKSLKNIIHSIRYLMFTIQILELGKISDYQCANEYFNQIFKMNFETWDEYFEKFTSIYRNLKSKVEND